MSNNRLIGHREKGGRNKRKRVIKEKLRKFSKQRTGIFKLKGPTVPSVVDEYRPSLAARQSLQNYRALRIKRKSYNCPEKK